MITLEEAQHRIDAAVQPLPPRKVPLLDAIGCCTAREVISRIDVPGFASSGMDGIAVAMRDLADMHHRRLKVQGIIAAGNVALEALKSGHAYRIMTGAPLPEGADTVIPVEELEFADDIVKINSRAVRGQHVRPAGNDVKAGQMVLPAGTRMRAIEAGICAGLGITQVEVHPRPKIALLATGSEVRNPGEKLLPGQIYNTNNASLRGLLVAGGWGDPDELPNLKDEIETLLPALEKLSRKYDVIITSGAVSAGEFDYLPDVAKRLGGELLFHKVAIKPGKPALMAKLGRSLLLSLPGNPVSAVVTFHLYAKRILRRLTGDLKVPKRERAMLSEPVNIDSDRFYVLGAYFERGEQGLTARGAKRYQSGRLSSIAGIDGFMFLEAGNYTMPEGAAVEVEWL